MVHVTRKALNEKPYLAAPQEVEHISTKLFTLTRFRRVKTERSMKTLIEFQSNHKLLLLAYRQSGYRDCERIVAHHENHDVDTVIAFYELSLKKVFQNRPKVKSIINSLLHVFGSVSEYLSPQEKRRFLNTVEDDRDEHVPLSTLNHLIHAYAIRFNIPYLLNQALLQPYPRDLVAVNG